MALASTKIALPKDVATAIVNRAKDASVIAALSPSTPMLFRDQEYMVFNSSAEAEVVEEGAAKSSYEQEVATVVAKRIKIQTTTRVTSELQWADEDAQLEIIRAIQDDQRDAMGRALDYVVLHGVNPRSGETLEGYARLSDTAVQVVATDDDVANIDALAEAVGDIYDVGGIALSKTLAARLRRLRVPSTGMRLYPEIPLNLQPGTLDGITAATSGTVSGRLAKEPTGTLAFLGDFSVVKWGIVRDMTAELIPYGDPDGQGDLKHYNQVAYRTEGVYGYAVVDPRAIAVLKTA